jgi:diadenosine tetraphosphate (Ap4A) HIT family hydrolase
LTPNKYGANYKDNKAMAYDQDNIFAKILRADIPCCAVFENDFVLAFQDIAPQAKTHILVIPKGAYTDIVDFSENGSAQEVHEFYKAAAHIARENGLTENGFRSIANTGAWGGQEVPHFHLHLLGGEVIGPMVSAK